MRRVFSGTSRDGAGNVVSSATVKLFEAGGTTAATFYSSATSTSGITSTTSGSDGTFSIYVDNFDYDADQTFKITIEKAGYSTKTTDNVRFDDVVLGTYSISADRTVTTNLVVPKGVIYSIATGKTLTISGPFEAGDYQVFSCVGTGKVVGLKEARPEWFGAVHDGATDDTAAINAAISSTNGPVDFYPSATYIVTLSSDSEEVGKYVACSLKSHMWIRGNGATIKLKDGESTNASPKHFNIFKKYDSVGLHDICFENLIIDENGLNNLINNTTAYTCSAFWLGGTATKERITIQNCKFKNNPGGNSVVVLNATTVRILNNDFTEQGLDTPDHSTIYCYGSDFIVNDNTFINSAVFVTGSFGVAVSCAACELHGPDMQFANNNVYNYLTGCIVCGQVSTSVSTERIIVNNNNLYVHWAGVSVLREVATWENVTNVSITGNNISISDVDHGNDYPKSGVKIIPYFSISDIYVVGNKISKATYDYLATGVWIWCRQPSETVSDISISSNEIDGMTYGIYAYQANTEGRMGSVSVNGNTIKNINVSTAYTPPGTIYGIYAASDVTTTAPFIVSGNTIDNSMVTTSIDVGVAINSTFSGAIIRGNTFSGLTDNVINYQYTAGTASTIYWNRDPNYYLILTDPAPDSKCTLTFVAPPKHSFLTLQIVQDGSGSRTISWPASVKWASGSAPTLTATANAVDIVTFFYNGTNYISVNVNLDVK